jgi:hypothetical protein
MRFCLAIRSLWQRSRLSDSLRSKTTDKYYTIDDLKAVNAFYESPAGQKLLATLPQVMQIGQAWGQKIGKEAADEAEKEMKKK